MSVNAKGTTYIIDYMPQGRHGPRVRLPCPPTVTTMEEARALDEALRRAALDARRGKKKQSPEAARVSDLWPDYEIWYGLHRAPASLTDIKSVWINHLKGSFGSIPVVALSEHHFTLYQSARMETRISPRTVNKELDYFRGFLRWCRRDRKIPVPDVQIAALPYNRPLPMVLSPGEVKLILGASTPFWRAFFGCLYSLALRKGEAQRLTWADLDRENRQIRTRQKGGTWKMLPVSDWLLGCLEEIRPDGWRAGDYIFKGKATGSFIQNARRAIEKACREAGITKRVHPHLFRHSMATHFMAAGVNQRMIQTFLGHKDASATEFYTTVSADHLRGMIAESGNPVSGERA